MTGSWKYANANRKPKACHYCGNEYKPLSASQLWCDDCAPNRFFMKLIRQFGMNKAAFDAVLVKQNGACAICKKAFAPEHRPGEYHQKPYPCIDHDHATGEFRGLVCLRCNTRLGGQGSEVRWLLNALMYLGYMANLEVIPLSVKDPMAQDLLWKYAQRRRVVDAEFSEDLEEALRLAGYEPPRAL